MAEAAQGEPQEQSPLSRKERKAVKRAAKRAAMIASSLLPPERHPSEYSQIEHRLKHVPYTVGGLQRGGVSVVSIDDPLRIDKLLRASVLNEMQHLWGTQIIALWTIADKAFLGAMNYDGIKGQFREGGMAQRMDAADQFYKTMLYLATPALEEVIAIRKRLQYPLRKSERQAETRQLHRLENIHKRDHDLICRICFDEMGCIEAARGLGVAINDATSTVRQAFDNLGDALAKMREVRKAIAKYADGAARITLGEPPPDGIIPAWRARYPYLQDAASQVIENHRMFCENGAAAYAQFAIPRSSHTDVFRGTVTSEGTTSTLAYNCERFDRLCQPRAGAMLTQFAQYMARTAFDMDIGGE